MRPGFRFLAALVLGLAAITWIASVSVQKTTRDWYEPVVDRGRTLGFVILVHDLGFVERREAKMQQFLLLAFGFLGVAAAAMTIVAARLSWRGWSRALCSFLKGEGHRPEFQPFMSDVRDLVDRIVAEKEADREGGDWTPQRLKQNDLDEASSALAAALEMSPTEQCDRMRSMRGFLSEFNVYRWAGRMLVDAARLRSRDRLTGRLADHLVAVGQASR